MQWSERVRENDTRIALSVEGDRTQVIYEGEGEDRLACDTTLRRMPDGSWVMVMLGFGHTEFGDQFFGEPISKERVVRVRTQVFKRQNDNRLHFWLDFRLRREQRVGECLG